MIPTIAARELTTVFKKKSTIISMVIMVVLIVAGQAIMKYFADQSDTQEYTFAASTDEVVQVLQQAGEASGVKVEAETLARADAEQKIKDGDLDAYVDGDEVVVDSQPSRALTFVTSSLQQAHIAKTAQDHGINVQDLVGAQPHITELDAEESTSRMTFVGMLVLMLMMMTIMGGGALIGMGVVEEKSSRVVEILLATVRPFQLLAGKVLGIGAGVMVQFVVYMAALFVGAHVFQVLPPGTNIDIPYLLLCLLWVALAYLIFGACWAALASTVSRQEDIGVATMPMTFIPLAAFYVAMFLVPNQPDSTLTAALCMVPIFTPFLMPMRMAVTTVPVWQTALALVIVIATAALLLLLAERIYRGAVLHSGSRMKLSEAFRRGKQAA
ncbi:MAG: ABC transporter permease [Bowdeniella nasicola]|nr:ABC transporter permease [Bowdeniella nasicola]